MFWKVVCCVFGIVFSVCANSLVVENVLLKKNDAHSAIVTFDLSWENSWRLNAVNHDAVWIFMKVTTNGTDYSHAKLYAADSGDLLNPVGEGVL